MKKTLLLTTCILLGHLNLSAQIKKIIRNNNGTIVNAAHAHFQRGSNLTLPSNVTSCSIDTIILNTQAQINNFSTNYPTCTTPKYLFIDGAGASPAITSLAGLSSITQVINKLKIQNTSLTNLSGLSSLTVIGDTLQLQNDTLLTSIGLNNLTQLGSIFFRNLPVLNSIAGLGNGRTSINNILVDTTALTSLSALGTLTSINGNCEIDHTPLPNLASINNVHQIQGWLWLDQDTLMTSIGLTNLTHCGFFLFSNLPHLTSMAGVSYHVDNPASGTFWIINTALTNLNGLDSLISAPNFYIIGNPNLTSLHGLEKLSGDIGSGFSIFNNNTLTNISALSGITSLNYGTLEVSYNGALGNLIGLGNIINIKGALWMESNGNITTLSDFNNNLNIRDSIVNTNTNIRDTVRVRYNNQLALCSFTPLCNYLSNNGGAYINDNAPGCNSITELQASCANIAGTSRTWTGSVSTQWSTGSNWNPNGTPSINDTIKIPTGLANYPALVSPTTIKQLTMDHGSTLSLNMNNFTVNGNATIDTAQILGSGNFTVNNSMSTYIIASTIGGSLICNNYSGNFSLIGDHISGNLYITDSSGRSQNAHFDDCQVDGNATIVNNGFDFLEGANNPAHPNFGNHISGNISITNNSSNGVYMDMNNGIQVDGNFTFNSSYPTYNNNNYNSILGDGFVGGNVLINLHNGYTESYTATIGGTINITASDGNLSIYDIKNLTPGGNISLLRLRSQDISNCNFKANIIDTSYYNDPIYYHVYFYDNTITGNLLLKDSIALTNIVEFYNNTINGNLTLSTKSSYATNDYNNHVSGNSLYINNGSGIMTIGLNSPSSYKGDLSIKSNNPSNIVLNKIDFNGPGVSTLKQLGSLPLTPNYLSISKSNTGALIFDHNVSVQTQLTLSSGVIKSDTSRLLFLNDNIVLNGGNDSSFISGPLYKVGHSYGGNGNLFPVGDSGRYAPVTLSGIPAGNTDTFAVTYFRKNPSSSYDTSLHVSSLNKVSGKEYWKINRNSGNTNPPVALTYSSNRSGPVSTLYSLRVAHWNGSQWTNEGGGDVTGDTSSAFVNSFGPETALGIFTLGFAPFHLPVITLGPVDSIVCHYAPQSNSTIGPDMQVRFSIDSLMFTNNTFTAKLSDSSGNFSNPVFLGNKISYHSDSIDASIPNGTPSGNHYRLRVYGSSPLDTSNTSAYFTISTKPLRIFSIIGSASVCSNLSTTKYYTSVKETGIIYSWLLSGGGSMTTNQDTAYITWTTPGTYTLSVSTSNYCGSGPNNSVNVTINPPPPTATPTLNNIGRWLYSTVPDANQNAQGIRWYNNNVLIAGAAGSSFYASAAGFFTSKYYNFCGNGPSSNSISFAAPSVPQTINFPMMGNKTYGDAPFVPTASASSGLPVAFTVVSGPATINAQTNLLTIIGTGVVTLIANQPGDNTYDTAAPVTRSFTVNKAPQTITFAPLPNQNFGVVPIQLSATASSGLPITFTIVSGPATINGFLLTLTGVGTVTVGSIQNGDTNFLAATSLNRSFCSSVVSLDPISGYTNLCPAIATYSVNNIPGATYSWRIAGGSMLSSTTNTVNVNWTTPGIYTLIVSASGSCGASSVNDSLSINVINSIQPDSVHNMLPANGAINQQLPLLLSWVPAQPSGYYTFDVYIWRADSSQPATPYVANLTTVNYTIPLNSGLAYNKTYKWMVVAHNGSCTIIHTGPIQQFSLIPLPDLVVSNVQIPATAFSGQTISINWKISNAGPGRTTTNQRWTDAVFLSFDSIPNFSLPPQTNPGAWRQIDFPIKPLLVGTMPNVTALDSGQFYTNSINFTLPLNYSQPLYAYVITNYPAGVNAPVQVTVANDTAHAPQPIAVTLSPTPDLRVDTVFTPATTFSGSTINLTYKVKNYGTLTPANNPWLDKIYISQSPFFDINSAILLKFPKLNNTYYANPPDAMIGIITQLQHDSLYINNLQVVIPNYIFGTYFIYVYTNQTGLLYEGANAGNNYNRSQMQIFLTPTPHLTVNSLSVFPVTTASTTQPIGVNWNVTNTGFNDNIERNKGHVYVYAANCTIPPPPCPIGPPGSICNPGPGTPGILIRDSVGFGSSFWKDRIYLSTDSSGLNIATAILLNTFYQGQQYAGYYVSDNYSNPQTVGCFTQGVNPAAFNVNTVHVIKPGGNYPSSAGVTIPDYLAQGNYYIYVLTNADKDVYEYPGLPETRRSSLPIAIQRPDATVSAVSAPSSAVGGQSIAINYSILNNGPGAVYNHFRRDNFYVSSSPVFNGTAQLISTLTYNEDLPVGTPIQHTINYSFPVSTNGARYIYIYTNYDSAFKETNPNNNISSGLSVSVSPAIPNDLVVTSVQVSDSIFTISPSYFKYTVQNNGTGVTAGMWTDSIYVSCNSTFNPATSYFIGKRSHLEFVSGGGSYTDSFYLNMPYLYSINSCFPQVAISNAYFYIKTNADNVVYENNISNNVTGSGLKIVINPVVDLMVTSVTGPDSATVGRSYPVNWTVKNIGYNPSNYYYYNGNYDAIYFSTDSVFNSNAVQATAFYESTVLNRNQSYSDFRNAIPPNILTGDYYVFLNTNSTRSIYAEKEYTNNTNLIRNASGAAKKIHVVLPQLPDLTDSVISAPSLVALGQPLSVVTNISNKGSGATYPNIWTDNVWLSTDFIPGNGNDILLSGLNHVGVLQPNQSFNDTVLASMPLNTLPGNYILISNVNATGNVFESNLNNNLAFKYITVYSPAPSDLIVESILKPDTVFLGYTLDTARWIIKNNSPNTANGISSDGIYLSKNATLDSTAVLLGIKNKNINMGPLSRDTVVMRPLVNNVVEGNYNVFVKTDVLNNIVESDKTNNTGKALGSLYVSVKQLPLNVLTSNTLYTTSRIYKLLIPDSLNGSTIQVVLKTGDSLTMKNQMFIGRGYIPSAANFDYTYNTPNYGNQQIVITSVTTGTYYISVRCVTPNPVIQNITLKAVKLPFVILSVQSTSGGNTGNVTIQINGSLFTPNMTAKLTKPGTTITSSAVYFTNSTIVYATFNLQGKPLGIYDVTLMKVDSTTASLGSAFSIVPANNGGLITGGGTNVGPGNGNSPGCAPGAASGLNSQLVTEMVIPAKVLIGSLFVIQINYNNPTNVDIPAQIRTLYSDHNAQMALTPAGVGSGSSSLYLELTEQNGPTGIIRAGGSGTITVYTRMPANIPGHTILHFNLK